MPSCTNSPKINYVILKCARIVTLENTPLTSHVIRGLVDLAGGGIHGPLLLEAFTQSEARTLVEREPLVALRPCVCVHGRGEGACMCTRRESHSHGTVTSQITVPNYVHNMILLFMYNLTGLPADISAHDCSSLFKLLGLDSCR